MTSLKIHIPSTIAPLHGAQQLCNSTRLEPFGGMAAVPTPPCLCRCFKRSLAETAQSGASCGSAAPSLYLRGVVDEAMIDR